VLKGSNRYPTFSVWLTYCSLFLFSLFASPCFCSIGHQRDRQCGPRILTFFLYLSDVDAGGGTNFPNLDITIMPKRGRALLWPSVLDSNPFNKDGRLMHQALPVEAGVKYAANGWIHMYDYQTPQKEGCN
jgi:prolyl 4-hydroxylase